MKKIKLEKLLELYGVYSDDKISNKFVYLSEVYLKKLILKYKEYQKNLALQQVKENKKYEREIQKDKKLFFSQAPDNMPIASEYAINPVTKKLLFKKNIKSNV